MGLQYLFLEPNADDPLNKGKVFNSIYKRKDIQVGNASNLSTLTEAAEDLKQNRKGFETNVKRTMAGGALKGIQYDTVVA